MLSIGFDYLFESENKNSLENSEQNMTNLAPSCIDATQSVICV